MSTTASPAVYTDFSGLAELRGRAQSDRQGALREAAQQFEALFLQMMLKSMRSASLGEGILDNAQSKQYRDMLDSQLSLSLSKGRGLGLADAIVRQLGGGQPTDSAATQQPARMPRSVAVAPATPVATESAKAVDANANADAGSVSATAETTVTAETPPAPPSPAAPDHFESPAHFVKALLPYATKAARLLGLGPEVLIAQSALETGWGQGVIRDAQGASSNNLFNIKADSRWNGPVVAKQTVEYVDGVAVRERALFRRYDSPEQAFQDYVDFLKGSDRYANALAQGGDAQGFARALQDAGYATDPAYAAKINSILDRFKSGELPPIPSS